MNSTSEHELVNMPNASSKKYDVDRLFNYALWYSGKYRSSRTKLAQKLALKGATETEIASVFESLAPYHSDELEIRTFIQNSILAGKSMRNFSQKMLAKGFKKSDIDPIVEEFSDQLADYSSFEREIHKRFDSMVAKGYGPRSIYDDLATKYPKLKEQIRSMTSELNESELLDAKYSESIRGDFANDTNESVNKKLFNTLVRRGFSYDAITRFLSKKR